MTFRPRVRSLPAAALWVFALLASAADAQTYEGAGEAAVGAARLFYGADA